VEECLLCKCEALSSNPSPTKKMKIDLKIKKLRERILKVFTVKK
jgi:hypothetical protein